MSEIPDTPLELITRPDSLRAALQRVRALRHLRLDITANGVLTSCPLRLSATNAVLSGRLTIDTTDENELDPETIVWRDAITAAGGTFEDDSVTLADELIKAIKTTTFSDKIVYLLPFLGADIIAARMPLRDTLGVGIATNTGFVDADFSQSTGLQGDGSSKYLATGINTNQLGSSSNGGLGYWERNMSTTDPQSQNIGARISGGSLWQIATEHTGRIVFYWGGVPGAIDLSRAVGNRHYYGQRTSATSRALYEDGVLIGSNTVSDTPVSTAQLYVMAIDSSFVGSGRCGVAYFTDGTLSASEAAALHDILDTYLITPTGR